KGIQLKIILLGERVILMVMALRTLHSYAQYTFTERISFVYGVGYTVFFFDHATFFRDFMVPVECRSKQLFFCGVRKDIAGQLPGHKPIIGHILVERMDHPVTPGPLGAYIVILITIRIRIP